MSIKILPARLANQIAAGEVVERPASVVKELVENSLDAGATRIDIDIEKGGSKLIRIRDNGKGIDKDELSLALSRHATSKIHTLDDLEAIMSLGFRGEALASISSVSRLTMTSRPATQDQAWSAYSEGRDMEVKLQPTAHPIGTSVEVLDLFFNTPARRKFLRTDKTEFTHIDELIKRIALSRFDVTINLRHNGKMVRQYRAAKTDAQAEKRIAAVCGAAFVRNMLKIELEHQGLKLHGWITTPDGARAQSDLQFCYVNGRMMRDKLINHAIRQSYETSLRADQFAAYILFIELDPHSVDVNVHPAKHEVRFHQARLVHDFIYQALSDALAQSKHIDAPQKTESAYHQPETPSDNVPFDDYREPVEQLASDTEDKQPCVSPQAYQAAESVPSYPGQSDYQPRSSSSEQSNSRNSQQAASRNNWVESNTHKGKQPAGQIQDKAPSYKEVRAYSELMQTLPDSEPQISGVSNKTAETKSAPTKQTKPITELGKAICVVDSQYLLVGGKNGAALVSLARAEWHRCYQQLSPNQEGLKTQPLLVPLSLKVEKDVIQSLERLNALLSPFGIEIKARNHATIMVMGVPQPLRQQNLQNLIPDLLSYALSNLTIESSQLAYWLADHVTLIKSDYTLSEAIQLIAELEQLYHGQLPLDESNFAQPVDFMATVSALKEK